MRTPCIRICVIDPASQLCSGCGRTLDEIGAWSAYDDRQRQTIMEHLPSRLATLRPIPEYSAE